MVNDFFDKQTSSSKIKANIVAEYFPKYCRILLSRYQPEIRYLDLFAGPGKYEDGNFSTPLLLAQTCANDNILSEKVRLLFNDKYYSEQLRINFRTHIGEDAFYYEPRFGEEIVGESDGIRKYLERVNTGKNPSPTLLFFDPWGYKGIDTMVLSKFLKNWGNELFLFVNTKRINAAINNDKFDDLMKSLFPTTINQLKRDKKYKARVHERLKLIMENLASEFEKGVDGKLYHCSFKFQEEDSIATSHFIIHFTKHQKGYELVKQVYHDFDNIGANLEEDGNYTFDAKKMGMNGHTLFDFDDENIQALSNKLVEKYSGCTISARTLFDEHQKNTIYSSVHYRDALRNLVDKKKLKATFNDNKEHRVSVLITKDCILEFKNE